MQKNTFIKSHGLGNDYVVFNQSDISFSLTEKSIKTICDVHYGVGSDGILLKVPSSTADFGLRIFNPDGSEAEKSGNGLRIFCKYLFDYGFTIKKHFSVETPGGIVRASIDETHNDKAFLITIEMGKATFVPVQIPVLVNSEECINFPLEINGRTYLINCVSVGNPHCVIVKDKLDIDEVMTVGPLIENHKLFPNRINVQFAKLVSKSEVEALIWERGAGYTMASGSSSCAIASVMHKLGLCGPSVNVTMPGGTLVIHIDTQWNLTMRGEVRQIAEGVLSDELINDVLMC